MKPARLLLVTVALAAGTLAPSARAGPLGELSANEAVARTCADGLLAPGAAGIARTNWTATGGGVATIELRGDDGSDWDLALFSGGEAVASSTSFTSIESAAAWVEPGERLAIQACRRSGDDATVAVSADLYATPPPEPSEERISLESVTIGGSADVQRLERLGFDVTDDVEAGSATVVTYSNAERTRLAAAGFDFFPAVRDLVATDAADRMAEAQAAQIGLRSALPSGREQYRVYTDYTTEMKDLATANPGLVRSLEIGRTFEGRPIEGVEIATDVTATDDGRPVYLNFGAHHAREWPSAELPMEFALDLVQRFNAGEPRVVSLLQRVRVIVVPIVNIDGFMVSRSFGTTPADDDPDATLPLSAAGQNAYHRKNCRPTVPGDPTPCMARTGQGVDLNRNYGAYWGGPGSSNNPATQNYRGSGPFSEPESDAVRQFTAKVHPTVFISNHTFTDGRWLRQPGFDAPFLAQTTVPTYDDGCPANNGTDMGAITPDEAQMKSLGDAMAGASGWISELGYETLCDITGATEDWNYFSQGTYGYTPEIRGANFHANYANMVVAEYGSGTSGLREAYLIAGERAASEADHSVIEGTAPTGATLRLRKQFQTPTCEDLGCAQGNGPSFTDVLDTRLTAPSGGTYQWHVNPSGRPLHPGETWTMSCQARGGPEVTQQVSVERGERVTVDWAASCTAPPGDSSAKRCRGKLATILGSGGADTLRGTSGRDVILARAGKDRIEARAGRDLVCGGGGRDRARGQGGGDRLFGGSGADVLIGGAGRDICGDASGSDKLRGCR